MKTDMIIIALVVVNLLLTLMHMFNKKELYTVNQQRAAARAASQNATDDACKNVKCDSCSECRGGTCYAVAGRCNFVAGKGSSIQSGGTPNPASVMQAGTGKNRE